MCSRQRVFHRVAADRVATEIESGLGRSDKWPAQVHHAFVTRLLQRSRALGPIASALHGRLDAALKARGQTIEDAIRAEGQHQAAEQASMANLIGSLRLISTFDWSEFFESISLVEQVLSVTRRACTAGWTSAAATDIATQSRNSPCRRERDSCCSR
jgi:hypothetical protein